MTPEQHLNTAENLLTAFTVGQGIQGHPVALANLVAACRHALIAHAIEMGVPHQAAEFGGGGTGAHPLEPRL